MADPVAQIKDMQRHDQTAKEQWYAYCEAYGNNVRDPAKHDHVFIESFITQYNNGARLEYKEGAVLQQMIKLGQKKSQHWKAIWEQYCQSKPSSEGKPLFDPAKHDSTFLEGFFDFIGKQALGMNAVMQGSPMPQLTGEPPNKRMRDSGGNAQGMTYGGDPVKDQLVNSVKAFQRRGEAERDIWQTYCDSEMGGVRDPSRHDSQALQQFADLNGIDANAAAGGGFNTGMAMNQGDPYKISLVSKIKAYQKQGQVEKDSWHSYCDDNLNGKYDPARTELSALEQFISTYGLNSELIS